MKLIVGLGNPGKKYSLTRHNAGFLLVDELCRIWQFPSFKVSKNFGAEISVSFFSPDNLKQGQINKRKIMLAKPHTYMNNSGVVVKKIMDFYQLTFSDILVVHDDLDLKPGQFKIVSNSRSAGHKGVQSIFDILGTKNILRIRIGIEGATKRKNRLIFGENYVLQNFSSEELTEVKKIFPAIIDSIQDILTQN